MNRSLCGTVSYGQEAMTNKHQIVTECGTTTAKDGDLSACDWDSFLARSDHSHHEQSSRYGANRVEFGFECDRIVIRSGGAVVGGAQILSVPTPIGRAATILRAPIAMNDDSSVLSEIAMQIDGLAKRRRFASVRVDTFPTQNAARGALEQAGFVSTVAWYREKRSAVIPLAADDDALLAQMHKNVRYYVRRADRVGLNVKASPNASIEEFYELHEMTAKYQGFPVFPIHYFRYLWDIFGRTGRMCIVSAYSGDRPIAAIANMITGGRMYYGWGGMDRSDAAKKMGSNYLLHVTAMQIARDRDCTHYDLSGDQAFKRQLAVEYVMWPKPMRKIYGWGRALKWRAMQLSSRPMMRRYVMKLSGKNGPQKKSQMPW